MGKLSENYEIGNLADLSTPELARRLQEMYTQLARAINLKADLVVRDTAVVGDETFLSDGTIYINNGVAPNTVQVLTDHPTTTAVTWTTVS